MEQAWTFDKYDMPRGDLEFWATRRGILDGSANRRARSVAASWRMTIARITLIGCASLATGLALLACLPPLG